MPPNQLILNRTLLRIPKSNYCTHYSLFLVSSQSCRIGIVIMVQRKEGVHYSTVDIKQKLAKSNQDQPQSLGIARGMYNNNSNISWFFIMTEMVSVEMTSFPASTHAPCLSIVTSKQHLYLMILPSAS